MIFELEWVVCRDGESVRFLKQCSLINTVWSKFTFLYEDMEDAHVCSLTPDEDSSANFFAVFDGHGGIHPVYNSFLLKFFV